MLQSRSTEDKLAKGITFPMVLIEGGEFQMGSAADDEGAYANERPVHPVYLDSFYMTEFPVVQEEWIAVMGKNPSKFKGAQRPVEQVSWKDVQEFIERLNNMTKKSYRLPSEAEWEYAARGGVHRQKESYLYAGSDKLKEVGWYRGNSDKETKEVGLKYPNELGLYDMSGNVWEWCNDLYDRNYYSDCKERGVGKNPQGPEKGVSRVFRGGGCFNDPQYCRVASRSYLEPANRDSNLGFRLALSLQSVG